MRRLKQALAAAGMVAGCGLAVPATAQSEATDPPPAFEISSNVALVSDYRFRGISNSNRDPAIQGGIDVSHQSGFFVGTWASSVHDYSGSSMELDLYGGYAGQARGVDYSVSFLGYVYPGGTATDYYELKGTAAKTIGPATIELTVAWVPDQKNYRGDNIYTAAALDVGIPDTPIGLRAAIGRETGGYDNKWDWELGASYTFGTLTASLSYIDTNYGGIDEAGHNARGAIVASLMAEF